MSLAKLRIDNIRNIRQAKLNPGPLANIIFGDNGSGKTSLLEAIQILASGKSFRTSHLRSIINHDAEFLRVVGEVVTPQRHVPIGIERGLGHTAVKIAGTRVNGVSELAFLLPVQYLGPESHRILELGPRFRRQLIDWGVFHVEQVYYSLWRKMQKLLKQRNAALRDKKHKETIAAWDKDLVDTAEQLTRHRHQYIDLLIPLFNEYVAQLSPGLQVTCCFAQGWSEQMSYQEVLKDAFERDRSKGVTMYGPHRADLVFRMAGVNAREELSRGQQKAVIMALRLAQVALLKQRSGRNCVILVDDLPSELDQAHQRRVLELLSDFNTQIFITSIHSETLQDVVEGAETKKFHVEHGVVKEVV